MQGYGITIRQNTQVGRLLGRPAYCYVLFQERAAKWLVLRCCPARNGAGAKPSGYSPVQSTSLRDASCTGGTLPRTVLSRSAGMPEGTRCQNFLWKFCKDAVPSSRHCADVHRTSASDYSSPFLRKKPDTHLGIRLFGTPKHSISETVRVEVFSPEILKVNTNRLPLPPSVS